MKQRGFTIVELLIVIVVIGILAAITVVAYNGVQQRARSVKAKTDITAAHKLIKAYYAENGSYPVTATSLFIDYGTSTARTDANCPGGTKQSDWIPGLSVSLPQSNPALKGAQGGSSCYMYVSDGKNYILSAWNAADAPQTSTMYRRLGFRESQQVNQFYLCAHGNIGGYRTGSYIEADDYYKYSYTFSDLTSCNETPPPGA